MVLDNLLGGPGGFRLGVVLDRVEGALISEMAVFILAGRLEALEGKLTQRSFLKLSLGEELVVREDQDEELTCKCMYV